MADDRLLVAGRQFHFLPVAPEIITVEQPRAHRNKMGLQMLGHCAAKAAALHGVVAGQPQKSSSGRASIAVNIAASEQTGPASV